MAKIYPRNLAMVPVIRSLSTVFAGTFRKQTPADVGGAGRYSYFPNEMGNAWVYIERFRGDDDLENRLNQRRAAAKLCTQWIWTRKLA